jgi:hypothetical protein
MPARIEDLLSNLGLTIRQIVRDYSAPREGRTIANVVYTARRLRNVMEALERGCDDSESASHTDIVCNSLVLIQRALILESRIHRYIRWEQNRHRRMKEQRYRYMREQHRRRREERRHQRRQDQQNRMVAARRVLYRVIGLLNQRERQLKRSPNRRVPLSRECARRVVRDINVITAYLESLPEEQRNNLIRDYFRSIPSMVGSFLRTLTDVRLECEGLLADERRGIEPAAALFENEEGPPLPLNWRPYTPAPL